MGRCTHYAYPRAAARGVTGGRQEQVGPSLPTCLEQEGSDDGVHLCDGHEPLRRGENEGILVALESRRQP